MTMAMPLLAQITDLHLRPPGVLTQRFIDTFPYAERAVRALMTRHPDIDAVLVTGDIADQGEPDAYDRAAALLALFSVPVLVVPGNHDLKAPLREALVSLPGVAHPPIPSRVAHAHRLGEITLVCLDTSIDSLNPSEFYGSLGAPQLAWIDETLAGAGPTVIAMHHPPFETGIAQMDKIGLTDAPAFAEIVRRHGNVMRIVCGHVHRTVVASFAGTTAMVIPGTAHQVSMALNDRAEFGATLEPPAYALHRVSADGVVSHVGYVDDGGGVHRFGGDDDG